MIAPLARRAGFGEVIKKLHEKNIPKIFCSYSLLFLVEHIYSLGKRAKYILYSSCTAMHCMRSEWLQQQFPEVYQTFAQDHDLIVSVPHIFRWSSSITSGTNSPSIKQTLPIRLYAGISQTQLPGVTIGTCQVYDQVTTSRKVYSMQQIIEETPQFAKITEQLLHKMGYT